MRYLVTARVKAGRGPALARAIAAGTLGSGSVAGGEYLRTGATDMEHDRDTRLLGLSPDRVERAV